MKIRAWHIDAFGLFRDYHVADLGDGLTLFLGPNEAGKSTLLAFLRGVLFGYAGAKGKAGRYEPLHGGRHGGKIVLQSESEGLVTVNRYNQRKDALTVVLGDGRAGSEEDLLRLLGQADRLLFQQVFAFSLSELQELETLESGAVRDKIFHAGIAGAGRSANQVVARLDSETRELYAGTRARSRVRAMLAELADLETQLAQARASAGQYSQLLREQEQRAAAVTELAKRQDELRLRIGRYHLLEDLWPIYAQHEQAAGRLTEMEPIDDFPAEAERRLAEIQSQRAAAQEAADSLDAARKTNQEQQQSLRQLLRDDLAPLRPACAAQAEDVHLHRQRLVQDRPRVQEQIVQTQRALDEALRELGPTWQAGDVERFDTSLPRMEEVRQWKGRLAQADTELARLAADDQAAQRQATLAEGERGRLARGLEAMPAVDATQLAEREAALDNLRTIQSTLEALWAQAQTQERLSKISIPDPAAGQPAERRRVTIMLVLFGVAVMAVGIWQLIADRPTAGGIIIALGLFWAAFAWALSRVKPPAGRATDILADLRAQHEHTRQQIAQFQSQAAAKARQAGLSDSPTPEQVLAGERACREDRDAIQARSAARQRLEEAGQTADARRDEADQAQKALQAGQARRDQAEQEFARWKAGASIPPTFSPDLAQAFLPRVESARQKLRSLDEARSHLKGLNSEIAAWQDHSRELLARAGRPASEQAGEGPVIDAMLELDQLCILDALRHQELQRLEKEAASMQTDAEQAAARLKRQREALAGLLAEAHAADETDFRRRHQVFQERRQLRRDVEIQKTALDGRLGRGDQAEQVRAELPSGRKDAWLQDRLAAEAELAQTKEAYVQAVQAQRDAEVACQDLAESADVPSLEMKLATVRTELASALDQWRIRTLASALVSTTLKRYVRERQPGVLAQAGRMFQQVSLGRYDRLELDSDAQGLTIIGANLDLKKPEQLSRGTAEQLYLCLRLALAREFAARPGEAGGRPCPLPLVMDDVLVNFDPKRARAMAAVLADFAQSNQVLLFTCHPQTAEMMREVCPGLRVEEMGK